MKKVIIATRWEVKIEGKERSIQLFDESGRKIGVDEPTRWDGSFDCSNNQLTSLTGAPKEVGGNFDCSSNQLTSLTGACEFGVKSFCESIKAGDKYTVSEVVIMTSGRYGHEAFKKFGWKK